MLVDCHTHLNNYTKRPVPTEQNLARLLERMKRYHVDHALVLTSYLVNEDRPRAVEVCELVKDHDNVSVVEGVTFEDGRPADLAGIRDRLERGLTVGLKLYPGYLPFYPFDPVCEPLYDMAMEFDVPVMFHAGDTYARGAKVKYSHPLHLDEVAVDHPDMTLVVCHLGNPWFRDTAEVVYKNDNVYADISGLVLEGYEANLERWLAEEVREIIAYAGDPAYLLYGTDWPLVRMGPYLQFVQSLGLPEHDLERLMWRNSRDLFGLKLGEQKRKPKRRPPRAARGTRRKKR
jgi:uncharacterized protein